MATQTDIAASEHWFLGEDKTLQFTVVDSVGAAQNITGWALEWVLRRGEGLTALLTKTTGAGITLTTPASGICTVTIADTDTDDFEPGGYWHTLRRTDAGTETVLAFGNVVLNAP